MLNAFCIIWLAILCLSVKIKYFGKNWTISFLKKMVSLYFVPIFSTDFACVCWTILRLFSVCLHWFFCDVLGWKEWDFQKDQPFGICIYIWSSYIPLLNITKFAGLKESNFAWSYPSPLLVLLHVLSCAFYYTKSLRNHWKGSVNPNQLSGFPVLY